MKRQIEKMPETVVVMLLLKQIHQHSREIPSPLLLLGTHGSTAGSGPSGAGLVALVLLPVGKDVANAGRGGEAVDVLEVLLGELEGTSGDVGNVLANKLAGVDGSLVDLLEQE